MRKMNVMALLFGAALFLGLGSTSAMAGMGEKCGAGKCGASLPGKCGNAQAMKAKMGNMTFAEKKKRCSTKLEVITACVDKASNSAEMAVCRDQVVALAKRIEKMHGKSAMKCGAGKCGGAKKAPAMKCGPGKCGAGKCGRK